MDTRKLGRCRLIALIAIFSFCNERAVSHPVDIEMTKRAYEQLKLANREALAVPRGGYVDNRESLYAMNVRYKVEGSDGGGSGGPVVSDPADFSGAFGSATVTDEEVYTWPSGAEAWGGFANNNKDLYPFSFPHGGRITFDASIPAGGSPVGVRFVFENAPYPDVYPNFSTDTVTVVGSEDKPYSVQIPAQDAKQEFRSLLMYITDRDAPIKITNVRVANAKHTTHSSDMQAIFGNLLQSVLSTRNTNSSLKLPKVPYPILIVLVDFTDENFEWDEEIHRNLVFGEGMTVEGFWDQNLHGAVDFIATPISGAADGIITVEFDGPHPNLTDNSELSSWLAANLGAYIVDYIDPLALDADFNGWLTRDELSVHFVLAGTYEKGGGFATPFNISYIDGRALTLNGIKVHGFGVAAEQGLGSGWSEEAQKGRLRSTLIHEFGHLFGATDKYLKEGDDPFDQWSVMDDSTYYADGRTYTPNAMALDKLETGMLESAEISLGGSVSLSGIADTLAPLGKLKEAKRVWLDPYKVRSSVLLEHRSGTGFDGPMENVGLIAAAVESLATSSAIDDPETTYRKGMPIVGTGAAESQGVGDLIDLTPRQDTPGYVADPTWAATTGSISIDSVGTDDSEIYVDLQSYGPARGHIRYDRPGTAGYNAEDSRITAPYWWYRYGGTEGESVTIFENDTAFTQIDGFELRLGGPSEVTVTFYEDVIDKQPYSLISSETFTIGSEAERGNWHRAYLSNPVAFAPGSKIAFSTAIRRADGEEAVVMQRRYFDVIDSQYTQKSIRNYWRPDERYSYYTDEGVVYGHILLMSQ